MQNFIRLIYIKRFFFFPAILFGVGLLSLIFLYPKGRSFFIINGIHSLPTDYLFKYATYLGDGIVAVVISLLVIAFYRYSAGIACLVGFAVTGGLNSVLKTFVFIDSQRPHLFFWNNPLIHYIDDVKVHIEHSFPSGHSTSAFFIFTFLTLLKWKNEVFMQLLFIFCACLAVYSRVYLAQHFVGDIVGGMTLGITGAFIFYAVYRKLKKVEKLNYRLIGKKL